jgi:hypothetical protein
LRKIFCGGYFLNLSLAAKPLKPLVQRKLSLLDYV